jgi:hypothetical protein
MIFVRNEGAVFTISVYNNTALERFLRHVTSFARKRVTLKIVFIPGVRNTQRLKRVICENTCTL